MNQTIVNCRIGIRTKIWEYVNIYNCTIGDDCMIGSFVEIQSDVVIGNHVRIQSHSFIPSGVTIQDHVFIGHHVVFINDNHPTVASTEDGNWLLSNTIIKTGAVIGSNATILGGITIGSNSIIGAGSVVTKDVPDNATYVGNPAHELIKS